MCKYVVEICIQKYSGFADINLPFRALDDAVLQVCHHFKRKLCQLACLLILLDRDLVGFAFEHERLHRTDDCRSASTEGFDNAVFLGCLDHLMDLEWTHRHFELLKFFKESEERLASDTWQNRAIQRRRD